MLVVMVKESKIVNEYDREIPQSQTADNPVAPRGRASKSTLGNKVEFRKIKATGSAIRDIRVIYSGHGYMTYDNN